MTREYCCEGLRVEVEDKTESPLYFWGNSLYCEGNWDKQAHSKTKRFLYCPFCGFKHD